MPRKRSDENLTKTVSSIISPEDFEFLERYAKLCYNHNLLKLPTISHMVRYILSNWVKDIRSRDQSFIRKLNQPGADNPTAGIDRAYFNRLLKPRKT